jgi:endonuclease YncB( thermonuclease family)
MRFIQWVALLAILGLPETFAGEVRCKVIAISDGDTFTCLDAQKNQIKVRMGGIDTPETGQPYGKQAKDVLSRLIFSKTIDLKTEGKDRYGRIIGHAYTGDTHVNREMVAVGAAWVYRTYNKDPSLLTLELAAQQSRLGLWSLPEADIVPPWEWRRVGKKLRPVVAEHKALLSKTSSSECAAKRYCGQMSSCSEARFYLEICGVVSLDGDRDGVPCEKICK